MSAQTIDHAVTTVGLLADVAGALLLAKGLFVTRNNAIQLRGQSGMSFFVDEPPTRDQMLQQPAVVDLLRRSSEGRDGDVRSSSSDFYFKRWVLGFLKYGILECHHLGRA
jgi:hypothetical protein